MKKHRPKHRPPRKNRPRLPDKPAVEDYLKLINETPPMHLTPEQQAVQEKVRQGETLTDEGWELLPPPPKTPPSDADLGEPPTALLIAMAMHQFGISKEEATKDVLKFIADMKGVQGQA